MTVQIGAMIVGLLLVSAASLWGLNALHQDFGLALASYHELRQLYQEVGGHLSAAVALLNSQHPDRDRAAAELDTASRRFDMVLSRNREASADDPRDDRAEEDVRKSLQNALAQLRTPPPEGQTDQDVLFADLHAVNDALSQMRTLAAAVRSTIQDRRDAATVKRRETMIAVSLICGVVVAAAVLIGVLQYRSVMTPLHRLGAGVKQIAQGQFKQRIDEPGSLEFAALASDFNRMACELDEFYHRLEQKVEEKSRELIRSERLASVGYLAAGVAHEINNPIGIIAGYAEYSLSQLQQQPKTEPNEDVSKSLQIICDEAFRCKDIIGKLLSLARPGENNRQLLDLGAVAREVASAVGGLRDYRERDLKVVIDPASNLAVSAVEAEMKQVVLNLTVNALEAVAPTGQVRIDVARQDGWVELRVKDNGRGMSPQTVERVFEPFYTEKRGAQRPGTGLGLSISHAIVQSHGGQIRAHSEGPGTGSEFVVRLPAAAEQRSVA